MPMPECRSGSSDQSRQSNVHQVGRSNSPLTCRATGTLTTHLPSVRALPAGDGVSPKAIGCAGADRARSVAKNTGTCAVVGGGGGGGGDGGRGAAIAGKRDRPSTLYLPTETMNRSV